MTNTAVYTDWLDEAVAHIERHGFTRSEDVSDGWVLFRSTHSASEVLVQVASREAASLVVEVIRRGSSSVALYDIHAASFTDAAGYLDALEDILVTAKRWLEY